MANNRLYIQDVTTGDAFCIAKSLGGGWYCCFKEEGLNAFFEDRDERMSVGNCVELGSTVLRLYVENEMEWDGLPTNKEK